MIEKILAGFFVAVSIIYLFFANEYSFGTVDAPKAGFLPNLAGGAAVILAFIVLIRQCRSKTREVLEQVNWRKLAMMVTGLVFYIVLFQVAGYIAATFIVVFYLFKVTDTVGWVFTGLLSVTVTASFYTVFVKVLGILLP